jgi:hypothetical protein
MLSAGEKVPMLKELQQTWHPLPALRFAEQGAQAGWLIK